MKSIRLFLLCSIAVTLSSCTTMQMLDEAGESLDQGQYGWGTFQSVAALSVGPFLDIVTLGGALDTPEKVDAASQTIQPLLLQQQRQRQLEAQQHQQAQQRPYQAALATVSEPRQPMPKTGEWQRLDEAISPQQPAASATQPTAQSLSGSTAADCIRLETSASGSRFLVNACSQKLGMIRFCWESNEASCSCYRGSDCGAGPIAAGSKELISGPKGQGSTSLRWSACFYQDWVKGTCRPQKFR